MKCFFTFCSAPHYYQSWRKAPDFRYGECQVAVLQIGLLAKGYNLTSVDAVFGSDTESKLISFQRNEGLTADGKAGLATMTILAGR